MSTLMPSEFSLPVPASTPAAHSRRGSIPKGAPTWTNGHGGSQAPGSYEDELRKEMNLLAEAAKRASVAIVVRDMKDL